MLDRWLAGYLDRRVATDVQIISQNLRVRCRPLKTEFGVDVTVEDPWSDLQLRSVGGRYRSRTAVRWRSKRRIVRCDGRVTR